MMRQESGRIDPKRRAVLNHKKQQFAAPSFKQQDYPHRLNFYNVPPTSEITLEEFEEWAISRLKGTWIHEERLTVRIALWERDVDYQL